MSQMKSLSDSSSSDEDNLIQRPSFHISGETCVKKRPAQQQTELKYPPKKRPFQNVEATNEQGPSKNWQTESTKTLEPSPSKKPIQNLEKTSKQILSVKCRIESAETPAGKAPNYSNVSKNIMEKMGYRNGLGLGKNAQGRVEIVEVSKQKGRRGLGLEVVGFENSNKEWDFGQEEVIIKESVEWMPDCTEDPPHIQEMRKWHKQGPKTRTIDKETEFCDKEILSRLLGSKSVFDVLAPEEMRGARTRSNPYETIRGGIFLNRAAMKMANMDSVFDFMFTNPKTESGEDVLKPMDLLYFADICSGPGGFSEYVLWRKKWHAKGFGFTLKGANDFKLEDFFAGPCESFEPHYGVNGHEGDGDIFNEKNLRGFRKFVLESTDGKGVHFVMADGGFSVEGEENIQEILSKQLYLCQFLCALTILRVGGHFVCKLFDLFTPFSVGLVYLLHRAFKKVCIHKPVTSRPANSERYVVCKWYREGAKDIQDYLFEVNSDLNRMKSVTSTIDIQQIVPLEILRQDVEFCDYITISNEKLADIQVLYLKKIQTFCENTDLHEVRQSEVRKKCLELWGVPDSVRSAPQRSHPSVKFRELIQSDSIDLCNHSLKALDSKTLESLNSVYDYYGVVSSVKMENNSSRTLILGLGRKHIYKWNMRPSNGAWVKLENWNLEIPDNTLLLAEEVSELRGEGRAQRKMQAIHVIDAAKLGGLDITKMPYIERVELIKKFLKAISKPSQPDSGTIRMKEVFPLNELESVFDRLTPHYVKNQRGMSRLCFPCDAEKFFLPHGILIFRVLQDKWTTAFSRSRNKIYYFNIKTKASVFDFPAEAAASFSSCFTNLIYWEWGDGAESCISGNFPDASKVSKQSFMDFLKEKQFH